MQENGVGAQNKPYLKPDLPVNEASKFLLLIRRVGIGFSLVSNWKHPH